MNIHRFRSVLTGNYLNVLRPAHTLTKQGDAEVFELLAKQDPEVCKVSGITVASVENYSPISKVAVVIKAGVRYEKHPKDQGIVHLLRNCSSLGTKSCTPFMLTRTLELLGAKLSSTSTREHLIYTLECPRDNTDDGLELLSEVVTNPAFKPHEVKHAASRMPFDLALLNTKPEALLFEALHKAAFRGGLNNSLYSPSYLIGKHTAEQLHEFVDEHFTAPRTSIFGLGVSPDSLKKSVEAKFQMRSGSCNDTVSKFAPGEVRIDADFPQVHVAIVSDGAGMNNPKEMLSLAVLESMFSSKLSPVGTAASKCTNNPFYVSGLSVSYSDAGLFGLYMTGLPEDMKTCISSVVGAMRELPKSNLIEKSLASAKHKLKARLAINRETQCGLLSSLATEFGQFGHFEVSHIHGLIDELQSADIAAVAAKVLKSKPAMAAVGRLHSTPSIDELL